MLPISAAIVVHYRSESTLTRTVADLLEATDHLGASVVVVDNSHTAPVHDTSRLTVLRPDANLGYAAAVNLGIRYILEREPRATSVLVCTHEIRINSDDVRGLESEGGVLDRVGAIAPVLVLDKTRGMIPGNVWSRGGYLSPLLKHACHYAENDRNRKIDWVDGACFILSVDAWKAVDGIPEEFFLYMEDVALGVLLRQSGYRIIVCESVLVEQAPTGPSRKLTLINRLLFLRRYTSRTNYYLGMVECLTRGFALFMLKGRSGRSKFRETLSVLREEAFRRRG